MSVDPTNLPAASSVDLVEMIAAELGLALDLLPALASEDAIEHLDRALSAAMQLSERAKSDGSLGPGGGR